MPSQVSCPNPRCGKTFRFEAGMLGRKAKCTQCGTEFAIEFETLGVPPGEAIREDTVVDDTLPRSVGRFRIVRRLGEGGMGAVYLAKDQALDRLVALKIPQAEVVRQPEFLERFQREAKAAAAFRHRNFCPIYDVGQADGVHFLTMAYIEGSTLGSRIGRDRSLEPREAAAIVRDLARAMAEAHRRGIVHRDLKPSNVMIEPDGTLIIMDFGLARIDRLSANGGQLTRTGAILGTPAYMAPEQWRGDPDQIGPPADIYALGVIFYQGLTGQLPFDGPPTQVIAKILTTHAPPPSSHRPGIDAALDAICMRATAKEPADRFGTCEELADALDRWIAAPTGASKLMQASDPITPPRRQPSWLPAAITAIAVMALVVAGASLWKRGHRDVPPEDLRIGANPSGGANPLIGANEAIAPAPRPVGGGSPGDPGERRWALRLEPGSSIRTNIRIDRGKPLTLEMLVSPESDGLAFLIGNQVLRPDGMHGLGLGIGKGSRRLVFAARDSKKFLVAEDVEPVPLNQYIHIAGTYSPDSPHIDLWRNGVVCASETLHSAIEANPLPILIGSAYKSMTKGEKGLFTAPFRGRIAWIRISEAYRGPDRQAIPPSTPNWDTDTTLLLDFTRGPSDPELIEAREKSGCLIDATARFIEESP